MRRASRPRPRVWRPVALRNADDVSTVTGLSPTIHAQEDGPRGPNGEAGTCYAFSTATAIRSAQMRIFGRAVESHEHLVREITREFGCDGANICQVLKWLCPLKNLHYEKISRQTAEELLQGVSSRVVLAAFSLDEAEWNRFSGFFEAGPAAVLQAEDLRGPAFGKIEGHGVVITGESQNAWFIKNSWGDEFADDGYFRVAKGAIDFRFYDVCFRTCDLHPSEISAYRLAPPVLDVFLQHPLRSERNPISSLGWEIDYETFRIERVRRRNCSIAQWNRENPFKRIHPGYQIISVNGKEDKHDFISELQNAESLEIRFVIISTLAKLDDLIDDRARQFSYAHTIATAIRKTQARIFTRPVELHDDIVDHLVMAWGTGNVEIAAVLQQTCGEYGFHFSHLNEFEACGEVSRPEGRNLIATFSLGACAWKRFDDFITKFPESMLLWEDVKNEPRLPQHMATVLVSGVGRSNGHLYWKVRDPWTGSSERSKVLFIANDAVDFTFYDMYFYITDLSRQEIRLFNEAPALCFVRVHRQRRWVRGMKSLGLNVNEETLQIEWIAPWSPIETQHNRCMNEVNRVYPGHFIIEVNGTDDRGRMLELLDNASTLSITVAHVLRDGTSA